MVTVKHDPNTYHQLLLFLCMSKITITYSNFLRNSPHIHVHVSYHRICAPSEDSNQLRIRTIQSDSPPEVIVDTCLYKRAPIEDSDQTVHLC